MKKFLAFVLTFFLIFTIPFYGLSVDSPKQPTPPSEIEEIIEEIQTKYHLTIIYIYITGETAAPTYSSEMDAGDSYFIISPSIKGYICTLPIVSGIMPARDVEYVVIYVPEKLKLISIENYDTPLGLGTTYMQLGICIE